MQGYFKEYPRERFTFLSPPEETFSIDLLGFTYVGRFDGIINYHDMLLVLDHKTSSRMGKHYYKRFRPDLQMTGYTWATEVITGEPCDGVLINVLYFTKTQIKYERQIISREKWELDQFVDVALSIMTEINEKDPNNIEEWRPRWTSCMKWGPCTYRDLCLCQEPETLIDSMFRVDTWDPLEDPVDRAERLDKNTQRLHINL